MSSRLAKPSPVTSTASKKARKDSLNSKFLVALSILTGGKTKDVCSTYDISGVQLICTLKYLTFIISVTIFSSELHRLEVTGNYSEFALKDSVKHFYRYSLFSVEILIL